VIIRPLACVIALAVIAATAAPRATAAARTVSKRTRHLALTATLAPDVVRLGSKISIVFDVTPKKGMHVYAPGTKYRAVAVALETNPSLEVHETIYPPPATYLFKPLNEEVLVYTARFRLTLDVTARATPGQQAAPGTRSRTKIRGQLTYQACDDTVCYLPASIPLEWMVTIAR
jgi:DsbC/DsbD-like thiol-disulfide interchange protein